MSEPVGKSDQFSHVATHFIWPRTSQRAECSTCSDVCNIVVISGRYFILFLLSLRPYI